MEGYSGDSVDGGEVLDASDTTPPLSTSPKALLSAEDALTLVPNTNNSNRCKVRLLPSKHADVSSMNCTSL